MKIIRYDDVTLGRQHTQLWSNNSNDILQYTYYEMINDITVRFLVHIRVNRVQESPFEMD